MNEFRLLEAMERVTGLGPTSQRPGRERGAERLTDRVVAMLIERSAGHRR